MSVRVTVHDATHPAIAAPRSPSLNATPHGRLKLCARWPSPDYFAYISHSALTQGTFRPGAPRWSPHVNRTGLMLAVGGFALAAMTKRSRSLHTAVKQRKSRSGPAHHHRPGGSEARSLLTLSFPLSRARPTRSHARPQSLRALHISARTHRTIGQDEHRCDHPGLIRSLKPTTLLGRSTKRIAAEDISNARNTKSGSYQGRNVVGRGRRSRRAGDSH